MSHHHTSNPDLGRDDFTRNSAFAPPGLITIFLISNQPATYWGKLLRQRRAPILQIGTGSHSYHPVSWRYARSVQARMNKRTGNQMTAIATRAPHSLTITADGPRAAMMHLRAKHLAGRGGHVKALTRYGAQWLISLNFATTERDAVKGNWLDEPRWLLLLHWMKIDDMR